MFIIDRFEGKRAIIEFHEDNEQFTFDLPRFLLPIEIKEGDRIEIEVRLKPSDDRVERIRKLSEELFEE